MREQMLKVVLVFVGSLFTAGVYPVAMDLGHGQVSDSGDTMMMSLYFTLGIFLLLAVRHPSEHPEPDRFFRVVKFRACVGYVGACAPPSGCRRTRGILGGSAVLVFIGVVLRWFPQSRLANRRPLRLPSTQGDRLLKRFARQRTL